jgi:DNA-binding SARP family transcriptional activator/tetratricopeptide (TPR) repeat protein
MRACLLGQLDIRVGGVRVTPLTSKRGRSLLGYLLLHRDTAPSREALAFALWPDSSEDQARTNLRNLLHTLRRAVPEIEGCLLITNRTVQWRPETQPWVDVEEFTQATEAARRAASGSDEMVDALRTALGLYAGDLLEDCYDDWIAGQRQRLRDSRVWALRRLTAALGDRGEYAEAVRIGRELVRTEPVEEENHRLLMRLHQAAGDRAAAVRAFHECATVLRRELGIAPGATTRRLHEAIVRAGDFDPAPDVAPAAAPATIVGREREWTELTRRWREAEAGRAQFVVVTGEPGIGKTRLIEELAAWCAQGGVIVCRARSYVTEGELGWGAVAAWLRTPDVAARLGRSPPGALAQLSRIVPELCPSVPTTADEAIPVDRGDGADGGARRQVFDAAARAIMSTGKAVLLVADDAQWCDATSLQFLHYLLREHLHGRLLVVASARREDIDDRHPLTAVLDGLTVLGRATEVPLHRLSREDTAALASQVLGRRLDAAAVADIYAGTEGNPLFIVETARAGAGGPSGRQTFTPPRLQAVIRARLAQLSEPAHDVLDLAATLGREFHADLIRHALGVDDITVASGLDELWRRGLIREQDVDAYDFSHGKVREVAYEALGPASRRANHLRVAEGLERLFATDATRASGQIATHYDRAGRTVEAVAWYRDAAIQALRMSAYAEAVHFLDRANQLLGAQSTPEALALRLEVVSALPTAVIGLEGFASDRLAEVQRMAVEMATALGVDPDPPVLRSLVLSSLCRDAFEEARAAAERLQASSEATTDHGMLVESRYLLGVASFWSGDLQAARRHFEAVVEGFAPQDQDAHVLRFGQDPKVVCLSRLANTLAFLGFDDEARHARGAALALADELGHPFSRDVALVFAALLAVDLDDDDGVKTYAARLAARADQGGPIGINAVAWRAYAEVLDGRTETGIAGIRAALASCGDRNPAPGFRATIYRLLVAAHVAANDAHGGLKTTEEALAVAGTRLWEPEIRRARATFLATLGDHAGAATELDKAQEVARTTGSLGPLQRIAATRARLSPTG